MAQTAIHLRESLVTASRDAWKARLIDLSRRNNLLFYRPLVTGTLALPVSPELTDFLAADRAMPLLDLFSGDELPVSTIRAITRKGLENLEEKGLSTLFLALGCCSWTAKDGRPRSLCSDPAVSGCAEVQGARPPVDRDRNNWGP